MNSGLLSSASANSVEDLDKLIQSFEFENQQHVKFIEKENQHIEELEKQIEEKKLCISQLQESTTKLDEETKRAHKQFIQNRDNCESLRKTASVVLDHEIALMKKLNSVVVLGEQESTDHHNVLQHYTNIWLDYKAKYESFPLAKMLEEKQQHLQKSQAKLDEVHNKIEEMTKAISGLQGDEVDFYDMKKFVVAVAEIKLDTKKTQSNITAKWKEKKDIETTIEEWREKKRQEEEARIIQAQREEAEKMALNQTRASTLGINPPVISEVGNNEGSSRQQDGRSSTEDLHSDSRTNFTNDEEQSTLSHMYEGSSPYVVQPTSRNINYAMATATVSQPTATVQVYAQQPYTGRQPPYNTQQQEPQYRGLMPIRERYANVTNSRSGGMSQQNFMIQSPAALPQPPMMTLSPQQVLTRVSQPQPCQQMSSAPRIQTTQISMPVQVEQQLPPAFKHPNMLEPVSQRASPPKTPRTGANSNSQQRSSPQFLLQSQPSPRVYQQPLNNQRQESMSSGIGRPATMVPLYMPQNPRVMAPAQRKKSPPITYTNRANQQEQYGHQVTVSQQQDSNNKQSTGDSAVITTMAQTPARNARPQSQPKTPESSVSNTPEAQTSSTPNADSPFDLEKHLARVRLLTKSPGEPEFPSRSMYGETTAANQSVQETQRMEPLDSNPFMQSFFPGGRGDGELFQTGFASEGFTEDNAKSLFGMTTNPDTRTEPQGMAFNFGGGGDTPNPGSMFSFFGDGSTNEKSSGTDVDSGFSFNFGGSGSTSPPTTAGSGFSLF